MDIRALKFWLDGRNKNPIQNGNSMFKASLMLGFNDLKFFFSIMYFTSFTTQICWLNS